MKIAIIAAPFSDQASTVRDSISCFFNFGNFDYSLVLLRGGEILQRLDYFDAVIVHYSVVAFPYRYPLPISSIAALRISKFKGLKLAFVQDEQRSGLERLEFLNSLKINHLFSVAPEEMHEILYPETQRHFSISRVLTGYYSNDHITLSKRNLPLQNRSLDLVYRGRNLPSWMGETGRIKGRIPNTVSADPRLAHYRCDVSSQESDRLYGARWFDFLQSGKVSIGTPSGSDFIDLEGAHSEPWLPKQTLKKTQATPPIRSNYQVISPRFFDYVAAGNLIALTPGNYSGIPIKGLYCEVDSNLHEIPEVIEFAKSKKAQKMVELNKEKILGDAKLGYQSLVEIVERTIDSLQPNTVSSLIEMQGKSQYAFQDVIESSSSKKIRTIFRKFARMVLKKSAVQLLAYFRFFRRRDIFKSLIELQKVSKGNYFDFLNVRLIYELNLLMYVLEITDLESFILQFKDGMITLKVMPESNPSFIDFYQPELGMKTEFWNLDFDSFGKTFLTTSLKQLPRRLGYNLSELQDYMKHLKDMQKYD